MSSVSKELITGIVYAKNARAVWEDLRERFDKMNISRVYQMHKAIATITQGADSVLVYFSKLRNIWNEFDNMKVLQFFMGLNKTYEQARSQILMISPTPRINKAYSMLVERESQRSVANIMTAGDVSDSAALLAGFKGKKKMNNAYNACAENNQPNVTARNT
ncbi:uncharacterized protein LOC107825216 [Nicotiana tabacum]|uniref:Uncharacterized protein LOC107825216 n=1 Tax=Nicotiana tabacum TaxID=4097 RepID=A0A1S4D2I3_TOBAC|nr:PREDICTED: uncharacterized protein LOC107825216 [Nicotiana tabacum]